MRTAKATLKSVSPYSQSRFHQTPKKAKETAQDWEERTWRERLHYTPTGEVMIPPMAFKQCIDAAARYLGVQIPGKGKSTYTKHFTSGVLVLDPLILPVKKDDVPGEWLHMNADGRRGSGKRVMRCYPRVDSWQGEVVFYVGDETVTQDVFEDTLRQAGQFIGIGRFRPANGGYFGRFSVESIEWS